MTGKPWWYLTGAAIVLLVAAGCNPSTYFGARGGMATPATGETPNPETTTAPAAPSLETAAAPDPDQRVRALEEQVQRLERRLAELEERRAAYPPAPGKTPAVKSSAKTGGPPAPPGGKATAPAATAPAGGQDKVFQEGIRLYQAKNYKASREKLAQYLKVQPQGPKAAEARYYLGDSFFQEKKFTEAKEEFGKVVRLHPNSLLAPTAMLRQAYAYQQLQQKANYQAALKKLVSKYPQSPEAQEARKLLKQAETSR